MALNFIARNATNLQVGHQGSGENGDQNHSAKNRDHNSSAPFYSIARIYTHAK